MLTGAQRAFRVPDGMRWETARPFPFLLPHKERNSTEPCGWRCSFIIHIFSKKRKNRRLPNFPGSFPPSIFSAGELNFCVRDGNRWNLSVIATGNCGYFVSLFCTLTTAHRMILQTVPISSQFSVSDLLSLDFALLTLRSAILIFSFQALNEAFDRLVSSSYTPYGASTDDLSTW